MFLPVDTLVYAAQSNRNHAAYCIATPDQSDRELIGPTVADNLDLIHEDFSTLPSASRHRLGRTLLRALESGLVPPALGRPQNDCPEALPLLLERGLTSLRARSRI